MAEVRRFVLRVVSLFRRNRAEAELEREIRAHLQLLEDKFTAQGMPAGAARLAARRAFGGIEQTKERQRDVRSLRWLHDMWQDVRFGLRSMRRTPVFAVVIVLSLALGIGANTALFSFIDATLLGELAVGEPEELVYLRWHARRDWLPDRDRFIGSGSIGAFGSRSPTFSNAAFKALEDQNQTLSDVFAFSLVTTVMTMIGGQPGTARAQLVSGDYFAGLRVRPVSGRGVEPADDAADASPVVVISYPFWERRFDRDPSAIGAEVYLEGAPFTIVGVAPKEFRGAVPLARARPDFWVPLAFAPRLRSHYGEPGLWWLSVMGRLDPGSTPDRVRGNLEGAFRAVLATTESVPAGDVPELRVLPARRGAVDEGPEDELEYAVTLGAIFTVLLLMVCLNVANLLLSRSASRRAEIGVRLALGAGRGRLVRQLLAENVTLAVTGGALGVAFAFWGRGLFATSGLVPPDLELRLSPGVLGLTAILATAAGLGFGLVPALRATRIPLTGLAERFQIRAPTRSRSGRAILVLQVSASVVLLVGAGLFVKTLGRWNSIETGFEIDNLLVFQVNPEALGYEAARAADVRDRLVTRVRSVPGVIAATSSGPFWRDRWFNELLIDGVSRTEAHHAPVPRYLAIRHNFFETLGVPIVTGRAFRPEENQGPPKVAIVDQHFVREHFGDGNPIGRRLSAHSTGREVEIVGVAGNLWLPGTRPEDVMATIYLPARARRADLEPESAQPINWYFRDTTSVEVRAAGDPTALLPAIRDAVREIDPNLPVEDPKTVAQGIREILAPTRVVSIIWLSFGSVALMLTAIGLYGLLAARVAERTREIGIRTALGARRIDIIRLVTGQTLWLVSFGMAIGLAVSMFINQVARASIFGVTLYDPATLIGVIGIFVLATSVAAMLPARRALRVDPATALRWE